MTLTRPKVEMCAGGLASCQALIDGSTLEGMHMRDRPFTLIRLLSAVLKVRPWNGFHALAFDPRVGMPALEINA